MAGPRLDFSVATKEIATAQQNLDKLVDASARAAKSSDVLETASKRAAAALNSETASAKDAANALAGMKRAEEAAAAQDKLAVTAKKARDVLADESRTADGLSKALRDTSAALGKAQATGAQAHAALATGAKEAAAATGLAGWQVQQLSFQLNDIMTGLMSGQRPFQVMAQQGGQVYQVLQMGQGGVGGALVAIRNGLLGLVTPGRAALGGIAAMAAVGGAALLTLEARANSAQQAVNGIGARSGLSNGGLLALARRNANGLTPGAAEDAAMTFARAGIDGSQIGALTASTQRYARSFGLSPEDAAKELAAAFSDPVKGADELNRRFGLLSAKLETEIRLRVEAGDRMGALTLLQKEFADALNKATPAVGFFREQIEKLKSGGGTIWRGFEDLASRLFRGPNADQRTRDLVKERDAILERYNKNPEYFAPALKRLNEINAELLKLDEARLAKAKKDQADGEQQKLNERSRQVAGTIDRLVPEAADARSARSTYEQLRKGQGDSALADALGLTSGALPTALQRAKTALEQALITPLERLRQDGAVAERMALARTLAERALASAEQARLQTLRATRDELQAAQAAENARRQAIAEATKEARDTLRTARQRAELVGLNPLDRGLAEIRQRYENQSLRIGGNVPGLPTPAPANNNASAPSGASSIAVNRHGLDAAFERLLRLLEEAVPGMTRTSGFRDSEKQAELYRRYGPGKAAPPGASNHEFGIAADYIIPGGALDEARKIAATLGLRINRSNGGAYHVEPVNARAIRLGQSQAAPAAAGAASPAGARPLTVGGGDRDAILAAARATEEKAYRDEQSIKFIKDMNTALRESREDLTLQAQMLGKSAQEIEAATYKQRQLNAAYREGGVALRESLRPAIQQATEEMRKQADERERLAKIKQGWDDLRSAAAGFSSAVVGAFRAGKSGSEAFKAGLQSLGDKMLQLAQNQLLEILFGKQGQMGGILGALAGSLLGPGTVAPFAAGGVMTPRGPVELRRYAAGGVADRPQVAMYGEGDRPEAFVPLADGRSIPVTIKAGQQRGPSNFSQAFNMGGTNINIAGDANERTIRQLRDEMNARDAGMLATLQRNFGNMAARYQSLYGGE